MTNTPALRIWLLALSLGATAPSIAAAQVLPLEIENDEVKADLREYRELILDYRREGGDAVERILLWEKKRIARGLASIGTARDEVRLWGIARFKAAAMMHTDAALQRMERSEIDDALLHIDTASQLLTKAGKELDVYAGRWCQAVARVLRSANFFPAAERFLELARRRWPGEPTVLYESGALQELLASDTQVPVVRYLPTLRGGPPSIEVETAEPAVPLTRDDVDELKRRRADRLERAARWFRESLDRDPSHVPARLRLGRVQTLRNRNDDARKLLQEAATSEAAEVAYLALLFTGALEERQGRLEAAAQSYRAGIERFPLNHAAHIGLSAVLRRSGRTDESRATLARILDGTVASRRDPWWWYFVEPSNVNVARLDQLRREARQ